MIKIKRFGLIDVTEEHLARADGRSSLFDKGEGCLNTKAVKQWHSGFAVVVSILESFVLPLCLPTCQLLLCSINCPEGDPRALKTIESEKKVL